MGEQSSICIQKKTILTLTMIVFAMTIYLCKYRIEDSNITEVTASIDNIEVVDENEDDITSENTKFAAVKVVEEIISGDNEKSMASVKVEEENAVSKNVSHETKPKSIAPTEYERIVEASSTAYCLCKKCCGKSPESSGYGVTASGYKIVPGSGDKVIAVDPSVIPLGSKVYIENAGRGWDYGYAVAADTGSAIIGAKVDLYMDTHEEALGWGRRNVRVYVIK